MYKARDRELRRYNISARRSAILFVANNLGRKATPTEISYWLSKEPHSIAEIINRMEKEGLVKKVKDLGRKNLVRVALTPKGLKVHYQSLKRETTHKIMSSLSEKEHQQLRSLLLTLRSKALEEIGIEHKLRHLGKRVTEVPCSQAVG